MIGEEDCYPVLSPDLGQVTLLCLLSARVNTFSKFKTAHSDPPQPKYSKRRRKRQEGDNKEKLW